MVELDLMEWKRFTKIIEGWQEDSSLVLASADLDTFKQLNDTYGRGVGDQVLKLVASALADAVPDGHVAHRFGDEFAVALGDCTPEELLLVLEEFRGGIGDRRRRLDGVAIEIPVSIGIAGFPHHVESPEELIGAAEQAMQRAKREGGNRVAMYVEEKMVLKSNYYQRSQLTRLASIASATDRTESSLLREALSEYLDRNRDLT